MDNPLRIHFLQNNEHHKKRYIILKAILVLRMSSFLVINQERWILSKMNIMYYVLDRQTKKLRIKNFYFLANKIVKREFINFEIIFPLYKNNFKTSKLDLIFETFINFTKFVF